MRYLALLVLLWSLPAMAQDVPFRADDHISPNSFIIGNNVTPIIVSKLPATAYSIDAFNNSTTLAYIKIYNSSGTDAVGNAIACGTSSIVPVWRGMIPFGTSSSGGGFTLPNINGDVYSNGIMMCVTTGIADSDTGAPAATTYIINVHWKKNQ
jgi:hypothetical protein